MAFVDTNILLRWLLGDHAELSAKAEKIIAESSPGELIVTEIVTSEIVYVLRATGRDRKQTIIALNLIASTDGFSYEHEDLMGQIIGFFEQSSLDFADCYLVARSIRGNKTLQTFDLEMNKFYEQQNKIN